MFGKASLVLVLGFSALFLLYSSKMLSVANNSVDVYSLYYNRTMATNIATSGANLAANALFTSSIWTSPYTRTPFSGGYLTVNSTDIAGGIKQVNAISEYMGTIDTVSIKLRPGNFSKFAGYTCTVPTDGNYWYATGDTIWGSIHVNGKLKVRGNPVFYGKVTAKDGIQYYSSKGSDAPKFYGGYESGINIGLPASLTLLTTAGKKFSNTNLFLILNSSGTVSYKTSTGTTPPNGSWTTVAITSLTSNGLLAVEKGNIYVQGTLKGQLTLYAAQGTGTTSSGNIYFDNDVVYTSDPNSKTCTDLCGMIADNSFYVRTSSADKDLNIHASMMAVKGGMRSEDFSMGSKCATLYITGGLHEANPQAKGTCDFDWNSGSNSNQRSYKHGHKIRIKFVSRLNVTSPNSYPTTGSYEILSWYN